MTGPGPRAWNSTLPARSRPMPRKQWSPQSPVLPETGRKTAATRKGRATGAATGQPKPPGEFTAKVKLAVRKRAGSGDIFDAACEGCRRRLGRYGGEYQHRAARGSGGCRDEIVNGPANCLLLCRLCHAEAEERRRDLSQDGAGFWIEHGNGPDYDPRFVAVMLGALGSSGVTVWLAADGTGYSQQAPEGAVA